MALYKDTTKLVKSDHEEFDKIHAPGVEAYNAGIYRCVTCGDEIGIAKGHKLPPQNKDQHPAKCGDVKWKLLVCAIQVKN